ncbi:MAG: dihydropteroate synthase [Clostridiales bacterium]|nr:dihydropteroate synthase [Clostridiales bacterium]
MRLYHLARANIPRLIQEMQCLQVNAGGIKRMVPKGELLAFKVSGLANAAALILKQEFLSKGGEAALNHDAVLGAAHEQTVLLLATPAQYRAVCADLCAQPFGLAALSLELQAALDALSGVFAPMAYCNRYHSGELDFSRPLIMGIANITPDSFYDGGRYHTPQAAVEHILAMAEAGADIIDIGGASSRPDHTPVSAAEELERLLPVLEKVAPFLRLPLSVDTDKAEVVSAALNAGAAIINDTGGLKEDMAQLAAIAGVPLVLMHRGGGGDIVETVTDFFREGLARGEAAGIKRERFILDPGFGFGKDVAENLLLLNHLEDFRLLNRPLLVGVSNKRFIGAASDTPLYGRGAANIAAFVWALSHGAAIIRTHDPKSLREAALMIEKIENSDNKQTCK